MSHGKRYNAKEKKEILDYLENHTYREAMDKFGVSQMSLARWVKNKERRNTNTLLPHINEEIQNELRIHLKIIENLEYVKATALVSNSGQVILPKTKGFHSLFTTIEDYTTGFLVALSQGIFGTQKLFGIKKSKTTDNLSMIYETPLGVFIVNIWGQLILITTLDTRDEDTVQNKRKLTMDTYSFIEKIAKQISSIDLS
jgi:hypothetical protein